MTANRMSVVAMGVNPPVFALKQQESPLHLGNTAQSDIKFAEAFEGQTLSAEFVFVGEAWVLRCSGLYIRTGARSDLSECEVRPGMVIELRTRADDRRAASLEFSEYRKPTQDFSLRVYLPVEQECSITIGGTRECSIQLSDESLRSTAVRLVRHKHVWTLMAEGMRHISVNNQPVSRRMTLEDQMFLGVGRYRFYFHQGCLYTAADEGIHINGLSSKEEREQASALKYPVFMRSSRVRPEITPAEIEILAPKKKDEEPKRNVLLQVLPQMGSLALMIVLRGILGNGGMFVIYSASTMCLSLGVGVFSRREDKKNRLLKEQHRRDKYLEYINGKIAAITEARQQESLLMHRIFRPFEENLATVRNFDKGLFDRSPGDSDFMCVRLGTGSLPALTKIVAPKQEYKDTEDDLLNIPESIENKYRMLEDVPIVSNFRTANAVGVVGDESCCYEMLKSITMDLAVRQYYREIRFYYIFEEKDLPRYGWTRWLRNCSDENSTLRNLIYDDESAKVHLEQIYKVLAAREENQESHSSGADKSILPYYVIFVCDTERIRNHPLSQFFEKSAQLGCTFVFFNRYEELIPRGCSQLIRLDRTGNMGSLVVCGNDALVHRFQYPSISDSVVQEMVWKLCPVCVVEANLESSMTKSITLFELLGVRSASEIDLGRCWQESNIEKSMSVPLGVRSKNDVVYLDLDEKYHGPHGLVAGTTGSGKSEILQSYILSMAIHFQPEEVGFLIIDFKGGGMSKQFEKLPHLIGTITNIDGREIQRSLKSIQAELMRRQQLFDQVSSEEFYVNNIGKYIHLHKTQPEKAPVPLPHLIIVVDEFAELKSQYPEFMDKLISAARIGRTLGVHLILATQKPSGVVDDQIWSNSKFKLCLRVQTREDSKEVIKTPLAAEIREPGRAYLQVGNNEIFELFQSAYSGATLAEDTGKGHRFRLHEVNNWGGRKTVFDNRPKKSDDEKRTELGAIVDHIDGYCSRTGIQRLPLVCLQPLVTEVTLDKVLMPRPEEDHRIYATLGILDDPECHSQGPLKVDVTASNMFILGASQTGKTVLLTTAIMSLAHNYTPDDVNVYVIDGGNSIPKMLEKSGIVGGVCYREEEERISNLLGMLQREIDDRRRRFGQANVGSFNAYKEAGFTDMPAILVIMDGTVGFKEYCEGLFETFVGLSREANSVGMYFVVSSTQYSVMNSRIMIGFGTRLALNCNDTNEYSNLFDRCKVEPLDTPGRGLIMVEKRILEYQTAWYASGMTERERNTNAGEIIEQLNSGYGGRRARPVPMVPELLTAADLFAQERDFVPYRVPLGISYDTVETVHLNLMDHWLLPIVGRSRSGRTNMIRLILEYIQRTTFKNRTECYILDSLQRPLRHAGKEYGFVSEYSVDVTDGIGYIQAVADELESRQEYVVNNQDDVSEKELLAEFPLLLVVIAHPEFADRASKEIAESMNKIRKLARYKALIIVDNVENMSPANDLSKRVKAEKNGLLFEDLSNVSPMLFDISTAAKKQHSKPIRTGDMYIYRDGSVVRKLHTARSSDGD